MGDHLGNLVEQGARALGLIRNAGERRERAQIARVRGPGVLDLRAANESSTPKAAIRMAVPSSVPVRLPNA